MTYDIKQRVLDAIGFTLPAEYLGLHAAGRLQFGQSREDWQANWKTIVTTEPPALMCAPWFMTVEWHSAEEMIAWTSPEYWKPNRFVSFAGNGYGDQWVWDPDRADDKCIPVILCRHDENRAEIMAGSFSDFLYRILLEGFANISYDSRDELDVDDDGFKRYLDLNIQAVASCLPDNHIATLRSLLNNSLTDNEEEECLYLLSESEKARIIERDLSAGGVGTAFEHMNC